MIEFLEFDAPSLQSSPMQDSSRRKLGVYLPPNYSEKKAYPLVLVLAGWGSKSWKYLNDDSAFGQALDDGLNLALKDCPCIVAFPDGTSKLGFSQYINSKSLGNYQDYLADDIVNVLEKRYSLKQEAGFRAVTGHSSGGFGSLWLGFQRSDKFAHIYAAAADSFFEISILPAVTQIIPELEKAGGIDKFVQEFLSHPHPTGQGYSKFLTMMTLSLAPCYAPNLDAPSIKGDLFFDLKTGKLDESIWRKWTAWDPIHAVDKHAQSLKNLKTIILESGINDEYAAQLGHRQISQKLTRLKISHELIETPGKHGGQSWRLAGRIAKLAQKMA